MRYRAILYIDSDKKLEVKDFENIFFKMKKLDVKRVDIIDYGD